MFILSCGRSSFGATEIEHSTDHDHARRQSLYTESHDSPEPGADDHRSASHSEVSDTDRAPFRRFDAAMSSYDSMATRLKTASRTDFPSLWSSSPHSAARKQALVTATCSSDSDEIAIPELHVGQYQFFCPPQTWSSVFASPGDFTIRVDSVQERGGEIMVRLAVVCCSVQAIKDAPPMTGIATKRKSFVQFVERSHRELVKFCETMALKYLGHRLMEKLPQLVTSVLSTPQKQLDKHGDDVTIFLSGLLSITQVGYNHLVTLQEPVAKNLFVRDFFNLSLGFGDPGMLSTSSCDARLERRTQSHMSVPSAWFGVLDSAQCKSYSHRHPDESPRRSVPLRSYSSRLSDNGFESKVSHTRASTPTSTNTGVAGGTTALAGAHQPACIRFVRPSRWHHSESALTDGAFTIEITGIVIADGKATYTICVLYYARGKLETSTVERRFSEFDAMVNRIERKLRALPLRNHFPTKTVFRYLSVPYLERRAAYLQRFLEKLLQMRFLGVLDQEISMVAEPNIRKFLQLPSVEWSVTPWRLCLSPRGQRSMALTRTGPLKHDLSGYSDSPSAGGESLFSSTSHSSGVGFGTHDISDPPAATYFTFNNRRTGSM